MYLLFVQFVQVAFMAEEWVDHSLNMARDAKAKQEVTERAYTDAEKKLKETIAQLAEVEKARRNVESALSSYEKQATEALEAQRKAKNKMALTVVELKQANKELEKMEKEKAETEQMAYDAGMTKAAESLTTQLRALPMPYA